MPGRGGHASDRGRRVDQPRPGRALRAAAEAGRDAHRRDLRARARAGRARTRRSPRRGSGPHVSLTGAVGHDPFAAEALALLEEGGVGLDGVRRVDRPTGVALIVVAADGENQIVVAPGANGAVDAAPGARRGRRRALPARDPGRDGHCRVASRAVPLPERRAGAAAPAELLDAVDLLVVNRYELEAVGGFAGLAALTLGAEGAVLLERGEEVARAAPPPVEAVDGTAAGDAFTACLLVSLLEGRDRAGGAPPRLRGRRDRGLAPGRPALASHRRGGRRDTQGMKILLDCDPGHDDAIALLLALASPGGRARRRHHRPRQPDAREDDA